MKKKGEEYRCDECGLVVIVTNPCECDETCELICCQEPMKPVKAAATKTSAPKTSQKASDKPKK